MVAVVLAALGLAVNVTCCGVPGTRVIELGETETPAGIPVAWTLMFEANPFNAVADNETEAELPAFTDWLDG